MKFSKRAQAIKASLTLAITSKAKKLKASGENVINFAAGEPYLDTPEHIKEAAIEAIRQGFTKYTPAAGAPFLKKAIIEKFKKDNNLEYNNSQIVVSCGAKHSLFNVMEVLCDEGDEVIIPAPYWVSYPEMVRFAGGQPVIIKTLEKNKFKFTTDTLEKYITAKTKILILNSPSNPAGTVYTKDELRKIAKVAVEHNIYVISDEIYEKIIYDNNRHASIASFDKDIYKLTVTINGVSKAYSMTGWRIGYLGASEEVAAKVNNLQSHSTSNPSSISQKAAWAALTSDERFVREMVREFDIRRKKMVSGLNRINGFSCDMPQGSFYCFCNTKETRLNSMDIANKLLDELKIAVIPGIAFGQENYIRVSYSCGYEEIDEGLRRLKELFG
ncbi:MAG: pyridoxal phosphate-dependent aminotransferase [Candidatus Omnitrophica bacterium]|nr:pyridoxal phosphate-dependent aminotransferase [Candidatus Omnitrophota bacterium]